MKAILKNLLSVAAVLNSVVLSTSTRAVASPPDATVTIGVILDLSGEAAEMGQEAVRGMRVAQKSFPPGMVNLEIEDTAGAAPRNALSAYNRLKGTRSVDAIIGPWGPDQTQALAPVAQRAHQDLFAMSMCVDEFKALRNVICTYPSTEDQLKLFPSLARKIELRKISLVLEDSVFAHSVIPILQRQSETGVFTIAGQTVFPPGSSDFNALVVQVLRQAPDAVFISHGNTALALNFVKALKARNFDGVVVAYIDIDKKYLSEFGKVVDGVYLPGYMSTSFGKQYTAEYQAMFGDAPTINYSAQGYDLVKGITRQVLDATKTPERQSASRFGLETLLDGNGAIAGYKIRGDRTAYIPLEVWQIQDRAFRTVDLQ